MDPKALLLRNLVYKHYEDIQKLEEDKKNICYDTTEENCGSMRVHIETNLIEDKIQCHLTRIQHLEEDLEADKENVPEFAFK